MYRNEDGVSRSAGGVKSKMSGTSVLIAGIQPDSHIVTVKLV